MISSNSSIQGLSHITFICKDIIKTAHMFKVIFGAEEVYCSGEKTHSLSKEKFLLVAGIWIALMQGASVEKTYNHIAFQVDADTFPELEEKIRAFGLSILPGRQRTHAEGMSLYFYDEDNHLFELHTGNLNDRLAYYHQAAISDKM